mgnify:CR=1 FL=1
MQAVWHGEMQLITDLDRVFEQGEDKNIDVVKREVRQYEKRRGSRKPRADKGRKRENAENKGQEKVG